MSWPHSNDANTFKQTFLQGYLDISGGDLIQRDGDVSFNNRLFVGNDVSFGNDLSVRGNIHMSGDILPDANETYNLGSSTRKFKDLYLSGNTIVLGNATVSAVGDAVNMPAGSQLDGAPIGGLNFAGAVDTTNDLLGLTGVQGGDTYVVNDTRYGYIARDNGPTTLSDWVSLGEIRGPQGEQGVKGQKGEIGNAGQKGNIGATGLIGPTGLGEQGIKGEKGGLGGPTGATGQKGESGTKGEFGGPTGPAGADGADGPAGADGATGQKGDSGLIDPSSNFTFSGDFFNIDSHDGSTTGLKLNDTLVTATAIKLNYLTNAQNSNENANSAIVTDSTGNVRLNGGFLELTAGKLAVNNNMIEVTNDNINVSNGDIIVTSGNITTNQDVISNRMFVANDVSFNKNLYVKENLIVDGNVSLKQYNNEYIVNTHTTNYDLIVAEDLSVNGNLLISGDVSLNSELSVAKRMFVNGIEFGHGGYDLSTNITIGTNILKDAVETGVSHPAFASDDNVAIGFNVLQNAAKTSNDSTRGNVAIGINSMNSIKAGGDNVAIGRLSMGNTANEFNSSVAIGYGALLGASNNNSRVSHNVGIGYSAGQYLIGGYNTLIGNNTGASNSNTFEYSTAIGYAAKFDESNQIMLGRSSEKVVIPGDASFNNNLYVAGSIAGTLTTPAQSNITSVGTLSSLTLSGHITPSTHGTINMGTDSLKFNEIHGVNIQSNTITVNSDISFAPNVGVVHQF